MKNSIRNRFLALGLLLSLAIPFAINSLHFVIFQHQHNHSLNDSGLRIDNNKETHHNCLWKYSVEELIDNSIIIVNNIENTFQYKETINLIKVVSDLFYFSLRAPPIFA